MSAEAGVRIERAPPGSLAERLGLRPGDLIRSVNGQQIQSDEDLRRLYEQFNQTRQTAWVIFEGRRNDTLYVKLLSSDSGAVVSGEMLSSLPPSVLAVLEGERNGGNFNPLHSATLGEWELATEHAVSGSKTLTINVSQN